MKELGDAHVQGGRAERQREGTKGSRGSRLGTPEKDGYCNPDRAVVGNPSASTRRRADARPLQASAGLTLRQAEVLKFISEFRGAHGFSPSIREIGDAFRIASTNGVADHLRALELKGCITRHEQAARTIVLTSLGESEVQGRGGE